jgi:hypothetical protein
MHFMVAPEQMEAQRKILRLPTTGQSMDEDLTSWDIVRISMVSVQFISHYKGSAHTPN